MMMMIRDLEDWQRHHLLRSRITHHALAAEFPEIESRDRAFREDAILYADGSVFEVSTYPLLRGDLATALAEPFTLVRRSIAGDIRMAKVINT